MFEVIFDFGNGTPVGARSLNEIQPISGRGHDILNEVAETHHYLI